MFSIIIPTRDSEAELARMFAPLVTEIVRGTIIDVVVFDSGSTDGTVHLAERAGCTVVKASDDVALPELIDAARSDWLLFLAPGTLLTADWHVAAGDHAHAADARGAAEFSVATPPGRTLWQRLFPVAPKLKPFQRGFLISKRQAMANAKPGQGPEDVMRGLAVRRLDAEVRPLPAR